MIIYLFSTLLIAAQRPIENTLADTASDAMIWLLRTLLILLCGTIIYMAKRTINQGDATKTAVQAIAVNIAAICTKQENMEKVQDELIVAKNEHAKKIAEIETHIGVCPSCPPFRKL